VATGAGSERTSSLSAQLQIRTAVTATYISDTFRVLFFIPRDVSRPSRAMSEHAVVVRVREAYTSTQTPQVRKQTCVVIRYVQVFRRFTTGSWARGAHLVYRKACGCRMASVVAAACRQLNSLHRLMAYTCAVCVLSWRVLRYTRIGARVACMCP
jgi:hypothetical protein